MLLYAFQYLFEASLVLKPSVIQKYISPRTLQVIRPVGKRWGHVVALFIPHLRITVVETVIRIFDSMLKYCAGEFL
jgi:hypothetical protein